jgi:hypothetical protein
MGLLAECRLHYERYLAGIDRAQVAAVEGAIGEAAAAVEQAGTHLAALARLAPGVAAMRRSGDPGDPSRPAELAEIGRLIAAGQTVVQATVAALRHRQAGIIAELEDLAGVAGPYAPPPAGSVLLDRSA